MGEVLTLPFIVTFLSAAMRMAVPLAYAAIGENISEKAGIFNVGLEAMMLSGAFIGFSAAFLTGSLLLGFVAGACGGMLFSMLHAFLSVYMRQDQNVAGVALNLFAVGFTSYLFMVLVAQHGAIPQMPTLEPITIPLLSKIPVLGEVLFQKDIVIYLLYVLTMLVTVFLNKTTWGLSLLSVGENPHAADTVGLPVYRIQYMAAAFNGAMGGLAGAYLVLGQLGAFYENITAGRGYIALAVVVFGNRRTVGIVLAALFFGAADALQFRLQALGITWPSQIFTGLPYVLTVLVLFLVVKKDVEPKSLGAPYIRTVR